MKLVILAGGFGSRLSEETHRTPKPLVEIGGKPIIWHIMKYYSQFGINEFIICCGYKGYLIKEYFSNYFLHNSNITLDFKSNETTFHQIKSEPWKVTLIDTGEKTLTGGRIKRIAPFLKDEENFCLTYGDGLSDVNISKLIEFHFDHGLLATITAVNPPSRFGALEIDSRHNVTSFQEKPLSLDSLINGGFLVLSSKVLDFIEGDNTSFEKEPLENLSSSNQLKAYKHIGFWQCMDTIRDKKILEEYWNSGKAPWKIWD